ncbi:MAG: PAS domain-containing protein [Acidimicrobiia bacterium]|nr:PAS domain-containing protein [Acidimicrobiia bacterium]
MLLAGITYANDAVATLVGLSAERLRGRHFASLMASDDSLGDLEQIATRVAAGRPRHGPSSAAGAMAPGSTSVQSSRRCVTSTAK